MFAYERPGIGGCLDRTLELVEGAGGRIAFPKTPLPGMGSIAHIIDSEENRVELHAIS